ncbi:hypothetical protein [Chitinophaga sp. RAB17]|uniref:hypothetical protein n=1 Tax=Chitinophaga sp. RAB17 TaxID=3233049 RepID=UPI003F8E5706
MKTKVSYLLLFCFALFLTSVNAAGPKSSVTAKKAAARVSCVGVPPFFYGFMYYPGQRVVYNGNLYQAITTNQAQYPGFSSAWAWFGPCN